MNGQIIPEETEKSIEVKQENATFLVIGDKAYTSEIIEEYNRNAEAKTEDFNTNAENKTASYNSNAADRTTAFNNNYDNKISAFNSNANKQTEEFDSHVLMQTNTFNNNAASTIANYNSNAEQKTTEFNQNALSYQEGIDANKKYIINVSNELERVKNDVLETGTDSDTLVHLEDSAMAEYQELSVDGVCEQVTTIGKNLLNTNNNIGEITQNGISISIENSMINFNGTSTIEDGTTQSFNKIYNFNKSIVLPAGNYTFGSKVISGSFITSANSRIATIKLLFASNDRSIQTNKGSTDFTTNSFTISDNNAIRGIQIITEGKILFNNLKLGLQLEEGSIATNWEPYTGGQPSPSPDYPQPISTIENNLKITSCNKNLFDITTFIDGTKTKTDRGVTAKINDDGSITLNGTATDTAYFDIKEDFIYGAYGMYVNSTLNSQTIDGYTLSVNITNGNTYFGHNTVNGLWSLSTIPNVTYNNAIVKIQLEQGSQATSYEQRLETQITTNLPEGEFIGKINDTYKDKLKVEYNEEDGQYHLNLYKNIGKYIEDGTNNFATAETSTDYAYFYTTRLDSLAKNIYNTKLSDCNRFQWVTDIQANKNVDNNYYTITNASVNKLRFSIKKSLLSEISNNGFKIWLSENPVEIYYVLETPYIVDLGIVDMPITYNEVTNLFTDSDLMPTINAKYYRNFITTIQNLQVNEKALKQELVDINTRLTVLENAQTITTQESEVVE